MYAGRVAEEGPVCRVFTAPRHPYTAEAAGGASRTSTPTGGRSRRHPGLAAGPARPAAGLPVRAALPGRDGRLHGGRPARGHLPDGVRVACHLYPAGREGGALISADEVAARRALPVRAGSAGRGARGGGRAARRRAREGAHPRSTASRSTSRSAAAWSIRLPRRPRRRRPGGRRDRPRDRARARSSASSASPARARRRPVGSSSS